MTMTNREPHADPSTVSVIRSEERMRTRTVAVPVERVRLEKYIVTEERTITVTVRREEVRLVREPIASEADFEVGFGVEAQHVPGTAAESDDISLVLHEEQVSVVTTVVPIERVTLQKRAVIEDRAVSADVRLEQVVVEDGTPTEGTAAR